jgi:hypothetical protein
MDWMTTMDGQLLPGRNCKEILKDLEAEKWFDPAFQGFINKEIVRFKEEEKDHQKKQ